MRLHESVLAVLAIAQAVKSSVVPNVESSYRGGILPRQVADEDEVEAPEGARSMGGMHAQGGDARQRMESYNFVKQTTADATANGKVGVILEPDLIPGTRGKDGARVVKRMRPSFLRRLAANIIRTIGAI
jgi:hypothetical protein